MGQARRKAEQIKQQEEMLAQADIPRLAGAIRKLATAASGHFGADCYIHASLAQQLLKRLDVESRLVVGHAAFRVGGGSGDVISHLPAAGMVPQPGGVPYHAWLEIGTMLLDVTVYSLREKARQLDLLDGGTTTVDWCPDYLFAPRSSISSFAQVRDLGAGLYYYAEDKAVTETVLRAASEPDPDDIETAWLLYQYADMLVMGPNDLRREQ